MPNSTAFLVLAIWPLVAVVLFRRLSVERAIIWTLLGGYLLLPPVAAFDWPLLPPLDKVLIPNILAMAGALVVLGHRIPLLPASRMARACALVFVLASIPTVLTNSEPIVFADDILPGLRLQDVISATGTQAILLFPYLLGRYFLASPEAHRDLLVALVVAALAYSLPALAEVRLSPQMNTYIYGFFHHDFRQMVRYGGYRPIVFLPHAIWLAVFMMMALTACTILLRSAEADMRLRLRLALVYLAGVLILCKTLGAILYALAALPLVLFLRPQVWVRVALVIALVALIYPLLRGAHLVPLDAILERAAAIDADRAESLAFRFENEEILLERANQKPLFGWGGWGRNHLYDWATAEIVTIADGRWIIAFGVHGWLGFLAEFGLLALPLGLLWMRMRRESGAVSPYVAGTALLLGINLLDLLPNATLLPLTWLMAGAVLGHAERVVVPAAGPVARVRARPRRRTVL